tara:strand:+ start:366 stop:1154 length:789 start_codon:yes stop_codon:yes gene_type:complete
MIYKNIEFFVKGNLAKIVLNRPDNGNTLNIDLAKELYSATSTVATNPKIKVLVLTGKGKLFCGGGDLKFLLSKQDSIKQTLLEMTHYFHGAIARMVRMDVPFIVGVNGTAGGGGFSLAITGDIILSVKDAKFTSAYTNAGLSPDGSSTYFLPRIVGLKKAKELMLTNRVLSATEALNINLIDQVLDNQNELDNALDEQTEIFIKGSKNAIAGAKKLLNLSLDNSLETQMDIEGLKISENAASRDGIEGLKAFSEKRKPNFNE